MFEIKKASEIREVQKSYLSNEMKKELEQIALRINEQMSRDHSFIYASPPGYLMDKISKYMKNLEYEVEYISNQRDDDYLKISWE